MIIKPADDKQQDLSILQSLLTHPDADAVTRNRIEKELRNIRAGTKGEAEAAYEMRAHYGDSPDWMVIHDLRIVHGDNVAQIDHLIINRQLDMWVCESKHFSEGVSINDHGEFTAFFGSKPYGVASPLAQNDRHVGILKSQLASGVIKLPTRLGITIKPSLKSLVLVSKGARISRPQVKVDGIEAVIKNDLLQKAIDKSTESPLIHPWIKMIGKLVGKDTLEGLAREIASLHQPIETNWHGKFGLTRHNPGKTSSVSTGVPSTPACAPRAAQTVPISQPQEKKQEPLLRHICATCNAAVPDNVARFCSQYKVRFHDKIYCFQCQQKVPRP